MCSKRHLVAALSALAADFCALFQLRVHAPAHLIATAGATFTGLSANATNVGVQVGVAKHEIGASEAHFCTILQAPDMICFGILAGFFQRVWDGFGTSSMATGAVVNGQLHAFIS